MRRMTDAGRPHLGQAFILLSKHDFLRRVPDGGEILYYALQRLISKFYSSFANGC